jgi:hypothetical protein
MNKTHNDQLTESINSLEVGFWRYLEYLCNLSPMELRKLWINIRNDEAERSYQEGRVTVRYKFRSDAFNSYDRGQLVTKLLLNRLNTD